MLRMRCVAQNYEWGLKGISSTVGKLYALGNGIDTKEDVPYAELWMGTHPSGPSVVLLEDSAGTSLLKDWLHAHPEALGTKVKERWNGELPFLFKVLSVAKALSIQAHPDKKLAEKLHSSQPKIYKDDNHKPEMAIAVTEFETLCGFVTSEELKRTLQTVPELHAIVGEPSAKAVFEAKTFDGENAALKASFTSLMTKENAKVATHLAELISRLQLESKTRDLTPKENLILRLEKQYPNDVGVFSAYFLNYLTLKTGEAIYLAANEPHAYLSGECIECMATSDNVVRAGLTPKYRDTDTLCSMLTYKQGLPEILRGTSVDGTTVLYTPPFEEFEVERIRVELGNTYKLATLHGPSVLLAFKGNGVAEHIYSGISSIRGLKAGEIYFLPANSEVQVSAVVESTGESEPVLELYRARVNNKIF